MSKTPEFEAYIAIDWSGAAGSYDGIAAAICQNGRSAPTLITPGSGRWTRREIAEWLKRRLSEGQRLLIGFDFAFGFPFEPNLGYLGGRVPGINNVFALWSLIEAKTCGEPDFGCLRFVKDPDYTSLFWTAGPKPERWCERKRRTEHACARYTLQDDTQQAGREGFDHRHASAASRPIVQTDSRRDLAVRAGTHVGYG